MFSKRDSIRCHSVVSKYKKQLLLRVNDPKKCIIYFKRQLCQQLRYIFYGVQTIQYEGKVEKNLNIRLNNH